MNAGAWWLTVAVLVSAGCSHIEEVPDDATDPEISPSTYAFDSETLCPRLDEVLVSAREGFGEIRRSTQAGGRTVNVWNTALSAGDAECRLVDLSGGAPVYVCSVSLPGPQSAVNWHEALQDALAGCLSPEQGWTSHSLEDRGGWITRLQEAGGKPPYVFIRHFRNDKMLSSRNWQGAVSVGNDRMGF